jgi:hypothetical protein
MWRLADILDASLTTWLMSSSQSLKGVVGVCIFRVITSRAMLFLWNVACIEANRVLRGNLNKETTWKN